MNRKIFVMLLLFAAAALIAAPGIAYEKNRLELIKPVKQGVLFLRPTFHSCSFYYGTDKLENPIVKFRKAGGEWKKALNEEVSLNCAAQCQGCGAAKYGVGICTQAKGGN